MKLILLQVSSLDGITSQGGNEDHHSWTSKEDQDFFYSTFETMPLIIMGSNTYKAAKDFMKHREGRVRIVLTRTPEKYDSEKIPGQLEFSNENPKELLERLEKTGITYGIHVGGASANTDFFREHLISEIWLTVEPILVGKGIGTIAENLQVPLTLISSEKLNEKGTLLLKYKVD